MPKLSGRPGQAIGPFTTGARVLQIQAGFDYGQSQKVGAFGSETKGRIISGDVVIRYGITERFEMSVGIAAKEDRTTTRSFFGENSVANKGVNAFSVRLRSNVYEGKGAIPSVGFQFNLALPTISKDFRPMQVAPKLTVMSAQRLGKRVGFTTNWGAVWDGTSEIPEAFYILNFSVDITNFMSIFTEQYANMGKGYWTGSVDGGFAFLINPDLQLDVLGGYGPFNKNDDWFVSTGISWRIRFNKREKVEKP
jgi:hypothetical protein